MTTPTRASLEAALKSDAKLQKAATEIAKNLADGVYDIAVLAEQLGFALTSPDTEARVAGTNLLSAVLSALPANTLNAEQLEFLASFYTDRLRDHHNVMPAIITGIGALAEMPNLPPKCVSLLLQAFFRYTTCQSQTRDDRTKLFHTFRYLTLHFQQELKALGGDFLYGLINSIDGERDPRNLDIIFSFMPEFIATYPLLHLAEEMFEIFACYFPIDFNPSKEDPKAITRDHLAAKLAHCLVASPEFAEWLVALAVEKLESDLLVSKLDSIELLRLAAVKFEPSVLEPHFEQIWLALKKETLPGVDNDDVVRAALKALSALLEHAASVPSISHNYQTIVLGVLLPHLTDVNQRLFNPATALALVCVAGDARYAADKILSSLLLKLQAPADSLSTEQRVKIYSIIAQVYKLSALRHALDTLDSSNTAAIQADVIAALRLFEQPDFDVTQLELQRAALNVLNECVPILSEAQRALVYKALVQLVSHPILDLDYTQLTIQLGALQPVELQSNLIDVCIRNFEIFSDFVKRKIFNNLLPLVPQMAFTQRILDLVMAQVFKPTTPEPTRLLALEALNKLLQQQDKQFVVELQQNFNLLHKLIELAQQTETLELPALEYIAAALSHIMQQLELAEQYAIVSEYLPSLRLQAAADLYVAKGLLGYLHKDISLDDHFERLLEDLTDLSLSSDNEQLRLIAHHLLCSLVNKIDHNEVNRGKLQAVIHKLKKSMKAGDARAVQALSWITKGLIVCGFGEASEIVGDLAELLEHPTLSTAAELAFDVLSAECPELDLPVVKYLYKQKFFQTILHKLGSKLATYCKHHLKAFVYVLKATPHAVLQLNLEKLAPYLFKSLETTDEHTLCIALGICENFVRHKDAYFQAHLNHLIPNCVRLSKCKQQPAMAVRISALQLLYDITKYPTFVLLPHKVDVTLDLAPALDDPKRLVRNMAVKARNAWYLVGAPSGD